MADDNSNANRYLKALLAPTFLAGVIMTVGGFIWFDAGQSATIKSHTDAISQARIDIDHLRSEAQINRDKDALDVRGQLDGIRHDIENWRHDVENSRSQDEQQYLAMDHTLQKLDAQITFVLTPKPDGRR